QPVAAHRRVLRHHQNAVRPVKELADHRGNLPHRFHQRPVVAAGLGLLGFGTSADGVARL
ncbi:MAG: hypothetical protein ACFB4J_17630, partial [Elainellaceae cyanobacterium]